MSGKDKDPNEGLAADAALAEDLGDEEDRRKEQLAYLGGEDDDIDNEDLDSADRGDEILDEAEIEARRLAAEKEAEKEDDDDDDSDEDDDDKEDDDKEDDDKEDDDKEDDDKEDDDDSDEDDDDDDSDEEDDDEKEEKPAKTTGIPRQRFNEVNERMKRAEKRLEELENTDKAKEDAEEEKFDFDKAEEEYMALLLEGKTKDAGAKRREIREAEKASFIAEATTQTKGEVSAESEQKTLDALSKEAETMFPIFDENSEDFNEAATRKVVVFMNGYIAGGMAPDDALVSGLADVLELYNVDTESQSDDDTEDKDEKEEKTPAKKKGARKKKPIKKVDKNLDDAEKQGKTPAGEGNGSDTAGVGSPKIEQMTDEEMDALPAEKLARMRGDFMD